MEAGPLGGIIVIWPGPTTLATVLLRSESGLKFQISNHDVVLFFLESLHRLYRSLFVRRNHKHDVRILTMVARCAYGCPWSLHSESVRITSDCDFFCFFIYQAQTTPICAERVKYPISVFGA